jgi:hypothetical protein
MKKKSLKKITSIVITFHKPSYIVSFYRGKESHVYVISAKSKMVWTLENKLSVYPVNISMIVYPMFFYKISGKGKSS